MIKFFKGMQPSHITQGFHSKHPALDIWGAYGTPMCAPEDVRIIAITSGEKYFSTTHEGLKRGYGIKMLGLESGLEYLYWHCLPVFPVWGNDLVKKGQIVAYMGNAGFVMSGGKEVPIDERLSPSKPGTHLHIQVSVNGKLIDPAPRIDWSEEPNYSVLDQMKAFMVVLTKAKLLL